MAYKLLRFQTSQNIHFATDFKENSMASGMNSGGSNDLNCIKIDPWTGEKFSFNVDIVADMAWQHPQQCTFIQSCTWIISRFIQWRRFCYCTVHYVIVDQWNLSLLKLHTKTEVDRVIVWCHRVGPRRLSGYVYGFLGDVILTLYIAWLGACARCT